MTAMFPTGVNLPQATRERMIALLNQQLADLFDLFSQTKQAHWNVKGPAFFALHELFDKLAADLLDTIDTVAERVTALGGLAAGTVRMAAQSSRLRELPLEGAAGQAVLRALVERYAAVANSTRAAIDVAANAGDQGTADLFTEVSRALDKMRWFLEAHLHTQ